MDADPDRPVLKPPGGLAVALTIIGSLTMIFIVEIMVLFIIVIAGLLLLGGLGYHVSIYK